MSNASSSFFENFQFTFIQINAVGHNCLEKEIIDAYLAWMHAVISA